MFLFVTETFMGEGGQNYKRKVVPFKYRLSTLFLHYEIGSTSLCIVPMILCVFLFIALFSCSRYDLEIDGRILLGKVDCTVEGDLCKRYFLD